ncbi:cytochrome b/b6 domain-containing protein [Salinispirillum sp. LH 10-3-1]|uniref:Cytochrome b/b6 domain-containing protein n=1 Tax=Salinispirillum sp. LH 10-3-1 TaxID=2952525 RepID=A0AB38YBM4_9GAMM
MSTNGEQTIVDVWDWPIRVFHWSLVVCLIALFVTVRQGWMQAHIFAGYALSGLLVFRLCWALVGTTYARLSGFNLSIGGFLHQLAAMARGNAPHYLGHNPAGALMVIVIVIVLALQIASGLFYTDDVFWFGPFFFSAPDWALHLAATLHPRLPALILLLALTHILAVLYHTLRLGEPLVGAMIHGRKPAASKHLARSAINRYWLLFSLVAALLWAGWLFTLPL